MKWSLGEQARRRLARERGAVVKDWGGRLPIALVYPNTYRVGMSSLGFQTIYRLFNADPRVVCERAFWQRHFAPDDPVVSIETQRALADFSVIAFSLSFEMDYLHLVHVLRQAGIPLRAEERDETWPLVLAGGAAVSANPMPVADFCDAVVIGEAEQLAAPLLQALQDAVVQPRNRAWSSLARLPGIFCPALPRPVDRQWVRNLDDHPTSTVVHTNDTEFGDMFLVEVARGCGRGCRFCMAGYTSRPKREHSIASILEQARRGLRWVDRIGLVGAAVSDYAAIDPLVEELRALGARLSVSSLRVDPLSEPLLRALAESGTRTLTIAPEAGSERLRRAINKGVTEDNVFHAVERAAHHRFRQLKLYFMLGLPTETERDVDEIAALCEAAAGRFGGQVILNVTPFVPKAHTPFQWAKMAPVKVVQGRLRSLERRLRRQRIAVRAESPRVAAVQGVLARGDRALGGVLASVQSESPRAWNEAMAAHGLEAGAYLRAREVDEPLPWDSIRSGIRVETLRREWRRAQSLEFTAPCPPSGCTQCGVCVPLEPNAPEP